MTTVCAHPGNPQACDKMSNGAPKALTALAIRQAETVAFTRMEYNLTRPLVAVRVEDGHRELHAVRKLFQKTPLWRESVLNHGN